MNKELDVCTNRPLKTTLKEMYPSLMAAGKHEQTPIEKIKQLNTDLL
jgi:hypothetical protein